MSFNKSFNCHNCIKYIGETEFSQENIKVGYIIKLSGWGRCRVIKTGKWNISYKILTGGAAGLDGKAAYSEIEKILSTEMQTDKHPFRVGEAFIVKKWNGDDYVDTEYIVTKITDEKVTIKSGTERPRTLKPRKFGRPGEESWSLEITGGLNGTVYKEAL